MIEKLISKIRGRWHWFYCTKLREWFFCYLCGDWTLKKNAYDVVDGFGTCIRCEEHVDKLMKEEEHTVYLKGKGKLVENRK